MAGTSAVSCECDPNFGIILSFMEQFGQFLDIGELNIAELKSMLENSDAVPQALADLHIKLMRKINKKVPAARWELALAKFAHSYSHQDAWEIERFGYKTANLAVKLRVLKALLEGQFDLNTKFKTQINTTGAGELRLDPLGRDRQGNCYWYFMDESANLQIYQSDAEMETWTLVARNRDEFVNMIEMLKENRPIEPLPAANAEVDEEEDSGGSVSESDAIKLGSIPAPSDAPPSLIISRRTYKTNDKANAPAVTEEGASSRDPDPEQSKTTTSTEGDVEIAEAPASSTESAKEGDKEEKDVPVENGDCLMKAADDQNTKGKTESEAPKSSESEATKEKIEPEKEIQQQQQQDEIEPLERTVQVKPDEENADVEMVPASSDVDSKCIEQAQEEKKAESLVKEEGKTQKTGEVTEVDRKQDDDRSETEQQMDTASESPVESGPQSTENNAPDIAKNAPIEESLSNQSEKKEEELAVNEPEQPQEEKKEDVGGPADEAEVSAPITDPPLVVRGAGSGADCDSETTVPLFSEVIEEPVMFFYGTGAGVENGMGNTKKAETTALTASAEEEENDALAGSETKANQSKDRKPSSGSPSASAKTTGNGESKACNKPVPKASAAVAAAANSDGVSSKNYAKEKSKAATSNDDGDGLKHDSRELTAKENDGMECGNQAYEEEGEEVQCNADDATGTQPATNKRTRKPSLVAEKAPVKAVPVRGKRNDKPTNDSAAASVKAPAGVEVAQEKPVEKKRGSRKNSTPKKAFGSTIAATAAAIHSEESMGETVLDSVKLKTEADETIAPQVDIKCTVKAEKNGDCLMVDDSHNKVKKEEEKESKETHVKEESRNDAAVTENVKGEGAAAEIKVTSGGDEPSTVVTIVKPCADDEKKTLETPGTEGASEEAQPEGESPAKRKRRQRNGLVDGLDISMVLDAGSDGGNNPPVRQSRRIAMQKIKEETNRRQIEDQMLKKMKADAVKKKKDLGMHISDDEYRRTSTPDQTESSSSDGGIGGDGRRRKKKKKKKKKGSFQQQLQQQQQLQAQLLKKQSTWNSATSPESSSETEAEDYFAENYHSEEDVRRSNMLKSDHEFSPESDLETEAPAQPLKRARTARKARRAPRGEAEEQEAEEDDGGDASDGDGGEDHACQECKKTDQPEWILLCDSCDKGYHCACLKPVLFTIPEGDWFCPVCQHRQLIERLQSKLALFDALQAKLEADAKRRQEEEQSAREAELAEQALEKEREEQLRAQKRARQQQRLLERGGGAADGAVGGGSGGGKGRRSRNRNRRRATKRGGRSRSGDDGSRSSGSGSGSDEGGSSGSRSGSGSGSSCTDSDDMPIYKHLRRRASTKVSYKFNEYDSLIDSAIRREMRDCEMMEVDQQDDEEEDDGHGFSKGKDISTIIEATEREAQARRLALQQLCDDDDEEEEEKAERTKDANASEHRLNGAPQEPRSEVDVPGTEVDRAKERKEEDGEAERPPKANAASARAALAAQKKGRKKKKKLCKIELSSEEEEEDDSDEDFRGDVSGSEDEEEEDDEDDEDENSLSGDSESSLDLGHRRGRGRKDRVRKPSSRAAASKRRRIVENSDDSEEEEDDDDARGRAKAKKSRKNRVLEDSDEELDLDDDDEDEDSEDYDSDDLCSDTETESSRGSSGSNSSSSSSSSSSASTEGDWRRKKSKKKKAKPSGGGGKSKSTKASVASSGGGLGSGKHLERPKKPSTAAEAVASSGEESGDSDRAGKGGKTMPRKPTAKKAAARSPRSPESGKGATGSGEKKTDRKTRGKKIHYIVDDDFESSDDGIRPGVQRPDTPPEEREQFIRRQEEIKRMLAENNAAKAKELATSRIDQLVGGRAGGAPKDSAKDSLSDVPMQVIESARILDIDFLKSTSGNTARISTVDSVVDFDDELPEDFDPDDEMDDEALAKIMEEEDFAHHQLKAPPAVVSSIAGPADLLPGVVGAASTKSSAQQQQQRARHIDPTSQARKEVMPVNLAAAAAASPALPPPGLQHHHAAVQSPMKALLKPTSIPTSTIMPPIGSAGGGGTILANALQTASAPHAHHHPPTPQPPPPLVKEAHGRPDVLMRSGLTSMQPPPPGSNLHHKSSSELSHLMVAAAAAAAAGLEGRGSSAGVPLPLAKTGASGGGSGVPSLSLPPHHSHHSSHRLPPTIGLGMPPSMLGHGPPPPHAPHLGLHAKLPPGVPPPPAAAASSGAGVGSQPSAATVAAAVAAAAAAAAAAAIGVAGAPGSVSGAPGSLTADAASVPPGGHGAAERRPGRRKKITPLREDLKRRGGGGNGGGPVAAEQSAVPSAAHQEQHQRPPPQHASQHHGHSMVRPPIAPPSAAAGPPPVGLRPSLPPATSIHSATHHSASAIAAAAAAAAVAQERAIKAHSRPGDGGAGAGVPGLHGNEPPLSVPSSVAHLSYLSENPLFAHRLGPLPSSILSSGSSSLQRIAAISGSAGPPTVYGDPSAYNGGWKPAPPGTGSKLKPSGPSAPQHHHPAGMMVGPPTIGSLEHYHEYNPANHYNPYYNVLDRAHLRPPPTIGELHRTSTLSPTTFTTLQPLEFPHMNLKPASDNHHQHHHHHSAASSPASTAGEDVGGGGRSSAAGSGGGERLVPSHGGGAAGPPPPPSAAVPSSSADNNHSSVAVAPSPPSSVTVAPAASTSPVPPPSSSALAAAAASTTAASTSSSSSTSVFGELVSYFSSQQDDLDS